MSSYDTIDVSLSGGVDSAITVAATREVLPHQTIHTFSAGFGRNDIELIGAAEIARRFGTEHHQLVLKPTDVPSLLHRVVWLLEDPVGREETAFGCMTSIAAAKHVEVLMSGYGADGLFAGMPRHRFIKWAFDFPVFRRPLADFLAHTRSGQKPKTLLGKAMTTLYFTGKTPFAPRVLRATQLPKTDDLKYGDQPLSRFLLNGILRDPVGSKIERLHSPFGIEFNSPFMDIKTIEYAFQIPDNLKILGKTQKHILRKAFADRLPPSVLSRRKTL